MIKRSIILIFFLCPFLQFAQDFSALWTGHFSYYNIKDVVNGGNKIYAASENAIFSYDTQTKEFSEITTVNGLSGEDISTIYYSEIYELLVIGYENGLIEIVFDDKENVLSVVDIVGKATIPTGDKRINHINAYENVIYISTNYGISVFDLERLEFGDTYFIGNSGSQLEVSQTTIFNGFIYAACQDGSGIRKAELINPNLIDYQNWQEITSGNYIGVETLENNLYAVNTNRRIYNVINDALTELFLYNQTPLDIKFTDDNLVITTQNDVFVYNSNFDLTSQISVNSEEFNTQFTSATISSEYAYIGTTDFGVLKTPLLNPISFEELHPEGPLLNKPFAITAGVNNLWVTFGEHDLFLNPFPLNNRGFSHLKGGNWINTPYSDVFEAKSLKTIRINPFNTNQVFIGSYFSGLLEVNDEIPTILHNQTNSGLTPLTFVANSTSTRVSSTTFDDNGLLWTLTNFTEKPLKAFNISNNSWQSFSFEEIIESAIDNNGFNDMVIGSDQTKWIASYGKGVIAFNENGGNKLIKNIVSEEQNMPAELVTALALDKRNQLWIGTFKGLRVLYNTSNFFSEEDVFVDEIIIEENGIAKELLFQQQITDIEVDGSNNKWIGTVQSGVFYLSSDGQKTIFHFTKDNSPLPTNSVSDVSIDSSNGIVYIATEKGLLSFNSGGSSTEEDLETAHVYPNPVRPTFNMVDEKIKIKGISENVNIKITDIEGNLVAEAQSKNNLRYNGYNLEIDGGTAYWNGKNLANNTVASGVYLVMLSDLDTFKTNVLKLMVVR
ncbi:MAG: ABC transporter substrate-binding protein [Algibacter sp.]